MANSSLFLGIKNMVAAKLGTSDVKLALGTKLLYPLSKPINDAVVTCDSATYNGSNQVAQNIVVTLSGVTLISGTDYTVTSNTGGTNAGSYNVTVSGTGNYEGSASGTFTINKANITPYVTIANWTYGETASNPTISGNLGGGTVTYYYKLQSSSSWSTTKPTDAGDYNIRADIAETINTYSGTCSNTFVIKKANSSLSFTVTNLTVEVGETKTNAVTVNAGDGTVIYSSNNTTAVTVNNSGVISGVAVGDAVITANISQTSNYNSASTSYTASSKYAVVAKIGVTTTTSPTRIASSTTSFSSIEIDSVMQPSVRTGYTFSTIGEHTVKYYLNSTTIGDSTFYGCTDIASITIPDSVTSIGNYAFEYCSGLTSITFNATTPPMLGISALTYTNDCAILVPTCSLVGTYRSASGWGGYSSRIMALDCPSLTATYNVTNTTIPTRIASGITSFSSIEIDGVEQPSVTTGYTFSTTGEHIVKYTLKDPTSIGISAFRECYNLTSITILYGVTSINYGTFNNCSGLTSITIPNSVTSIKSTAFAGCRSLTSVTIPNSVTSIGNNAFEYCSGLTSIVIPDSVITIFDGAFRYCSSLTSVTIGGGVTSINSNTFYGCSGLTSIVIPNTVTSIGNYAFSVCSSLTSVTIPNSVTSIGMNAFYDCSGLTSITIPNSVTSIGSSTFGGCRSLTSVTIPDSVTSIGSSTFNRCTSLTSCTIGSGVTSIGYGAFSGCTSLTSIDIPSGVTSIGDNVFSYCTSLTSIVSNATAAPTIYSSTFKNVGTNGTLTVPIGSSGYNIWMSTSSYYLGYYNWTKVEQ